MTATGSRLLVLHGLRLTGLATPPDLAAVHRLAPKQVADTLHELEAEGLVAPVRSMDERWRQTPAGRTEGEALLSRELDAAGPGARSAVTGAYHRFCALNQPMLEVCTRWQIVSRDPVVLNDHGDPHYDAEVLADLGEIDAIVQPICAELEAVLDRFDRYGPAFDQARQRLMRGELDWLTKPTVLSYHTVWFQLHEDLLATLGLERAAETARLNGSSTTSWPEGRAQIGPQPPHPVVVPPPTAHPDSPKDS